MSTSRITALSVLKEIYAAVGSRLELETIAQACVTATAKAMKADRAFIHLKDAAGQMPIVKEYTKAGITSLGVGSTILMPEVYLAHQMLTTVTSDDVLSDERFAESMARHLLRETHVLSAAATPVALPHAELGLLAVHQCRKHHSWSPKERELLETVASVVAVLVHGSRSLTEQERLYDSLARMNQDLSQLYVQLASKDEQIDRFMHLISHDLRSPVVAIKGLVDVLNKHYRDQPPEVPPRRYLEIIARSAEQITGLTTTLIDYARLGQSTMRLEQVKTDELVKEIWQRVSLATEDAALEIFGTLPVVRADRAKLGQIFQNLLENAIKYRQPQGKALIDITCQDIDEAWQFAVNDNGIGFHPAEAEKLFDIFARLKLSRTRPGSGIGLASVLEISRMHGGKAWAVGRPGKGSTFYFTIAKHIPERPSPARATTQMSQPQT